MAFEIWHGEGDDPDIYAYWREVKSILPREFVSKSVFHDNMFSPPHFRIYDHGDGELVVKGDCLTWCIEALYKDPNYGLDADGEYNAAVTAIMAALIKADCHLLYGLGGGPGMFQVVRKDPKVCEVSEAKVSRGPVVLNAYIGPVAASTPILLGDFGYINLDDVSAIARKDAVSNVEIVKKDRAPHSTTFNTNPDRDLYVVYLKSGASLNVTGDQVKPVMIFLKKQAEKKHNA